MAEGKWWEAYRKIQTHPELAEIYATQGHSPCLDEKLREMSQFLREENFVLDIPDHPAFVKVVQKILEERQAYEQWHSQDPSQKEGKAPDNPLLAVDERVWKRVVELHEAKGALVGYLNTEMGASLPTEIEYSLVENKPRDLESYRLDLNKLESKLRGVQGSRFEAYSDLSQAFEWIKWIREGLEQKGLINVFKLSRNLVWNLSGTFWEGGGDDKNLLDELLFNLAYAEEKVKPGDADFADTVFPDVKKYLENPRIQNAWLTRRYIQLLLRHEVVLRYPPPVNRVLGILVPIGILVLLFWFLPTWCGWIYAAFILYSWTTGFWFRLKQRPLLYVEAEVRAGTYSAPELARRLREMERNDVVVSTLLLGLLDLAPS